MKQLVTSYGFNKTAKTVTLSNYSTVSLAGLLLITNTTNNKIIYNFADSTTTATASGNVVTLSYDTTGMNNTDALQIFYEDGNPENCVQTISNYYVSVSGAVSVLMSGGSQSGAIYWGTGTSGQVQVQTVSGSYLSVSGAVSVTGSVQVSGAVQVSGTVTANTGLSGAAFSGQIAWGTGTSGQTWVQTTSGSYVSVSGSVAVTGGIQVSGSVQVSGTVTANTGLSGASFSGQIVWGTATSGQVNVQTTSGSYVSVSGSVAASITGGVQVSGAVQVSGTVTANTGLSGASFSGVIAWGTGTSGQQWVQTTSGSYVSVSGSVGIASGLYLASGLVVVTSVSGNAVSVASGLYLASGITVVTSVSGNSVGVASGIYLASGLSLASGLVVVTSVSGNSVSVASGLYLASGLVVATSVSGNTVGISISGSSISGAIVWGWGTSGQLPVFTTSGSWVTISGSFSANVSGNVVWGQGTSGQQWVQTTSGSYVSVSGSVGIASGLYLASGLIVVTSVSGNAVSVASGLYLTSGLYLASGLVVVTSVSGNTVGMSISGGSISGVWVQSSGEIQWGMGTSGQFWVQTTSGSYVSVSGAVGVASGLYLASGLVVVTSVSGNVLSQTSGAYLASGLVVVTSVSGNTVGISISGASLSGQIVWGTGTSGQTQLQLQYQLTIMSGITLGSGTLVSGGYMSAALTISTLNPLYLRYVAWTGTSGTIASGSALLIRFTPAGGAGTVTLTSTAFTSGVTTPITSYAFASFSGNVLMLLSGDIIQVTTISNNISGITQSVRILCGQ